MKKLCSDEACEEVIIPSGDFAAEAQGIFTGGSSDQVEGHVLDGDEVGWSVIGYGIHRRGTTCPGRAE